MNINRHNYEEFFILYVDDELSLSDRRAVDSFIQENPDLEEELVMLQQSKLIPEDDIIFGNKESLMKAVVGSPISIDNFEEWLLLYTDNELTDHEKSNVEKFAAANPAVQQQLELFRKTRLQPEENIVFPGKESLYRTEEKARVISIRWWRVAAAAVLFLGIGGTSLLVFNKPAGNNGNVAGINPTEVKNEKSPAKPAEKMAGAPVKVTENASDNEPSTNQSSGVRDVIDRTSKGNSAIAMHDAVHKKTNEDHVKNDALANNEIKDNHLPLPAYNPNMQGNEQVVAMADVKDNSPTRNELINSDPDVTPEKDPSLNIINASLPENNIADAEQSDKKGSVRGFLRKITRTIEKTTNIKATDDDDRLLVGGLAIKL